TRRTNRIHLAQHHVGPGRRPVESSRRPGMGSRYCPRRQLEGSRMAHRDWNMTSNNRTVTTTYEWDDNKVYIRGKYAVKEGDKVIESGTQLYGMDDADGGSRSWGFQADGGFGGGLWTREGKNWTIDFSGVT